MLPILFVEDDDDIRDSLADLLRGEGYEVHVAANGEEALEYLHQPGRDPCLVLLDLMMPVLNGWQVVEILRTEDRVATLPVVVLSAADAASSPAEARGFIRKPVDVDLLLAMVRRYCGCRSTTENE